MKLTTLLIVFTASFFSFQTPTRAQISISLDPLQQVDDTTGVDLSDYWMDLGPYYINIHNIGDSQIDLQWTVITPEDCPLDWGVRPSDEQQSFPTTVSTNYDPPLLDQPVPLPAGDSTFFSLLLLPYGQPGCCTYTIEFRDVNTPDIVLDSATIELRVNDTECLVTSTFAKQKKDLQIFPNPAADWLYFSQPLPRNALLTIYDVPGQVVALHQGLGNRLNVADLPAGLYFLQLTTDDGHRQTVPFLKE